MYDKMPVVILEAMCVTTGIIPVSLYCDWTDGTVHAWSGCATLSKRLNALWSWLSS